jgi:hypothetical protein
MERSVLMRLKLITKLRLHEPITLIDPFARDTRHASTL